MAHSSPVLLQKCRIRSNCSCKLERGILFCSGDLPDSTICGKRAGACDHRYESCLETQYFPESPNRPHFPLTVFSPGACFQSTTIYKFLTEVGPHPRVKNTVIHARAAVMQRIASGGPMLISNKKFCRGSLFGSEEENVCLLPVHQIFFRKRSSP